MPLPEELLRILVDPQDKGSLYYLVDEEALYNPRLKRRYEVRDGRIPVMLVEDAVSVDETEHQRLTDKVKKENLKPTGV